MPTYEIMVFNGNRFMAAIKYRRKNNGLGKNAEKMRTAMATFIAGSMGKIAAGIVMLTDFMVLLKRSQRLIQLRRPGKAA